MQMIEFVGMPRAGKTTQIELLENRLKDKGRSVAVIDDRTRASRLHVPVAESLAYVVAFASCALDQSFEHADTDFLLIDRGFNDVRVWADFYNDLKRITPTERDALKVTFGRFALQVALTLDFQVPVDEAIRRHSGLGHTIEADELVMAEPKLRVLKQAYEDNTFNLHHAIEIDGLQPIPEVEGRIWDALCKHGLAPV